MSYCPDYPPLALPKPFFRPQMHVLTARLLELDTTDAGNNARAYCYNQWRRERDGGTKKLWVACVATHSFLVPPGQRPLSNYFYA